MSEEMLALLYPESYPLQVDSVKTQEVYYLPPAELYLL